MDRETDLFWKEQEEQLHKKINSRALGQILLLDHTSTLPSWGLFFTTDDALYIKTFPSSNWFSKVLETAKKSRQKAEGEALLEIQQKDLKAVELKKEKKMLFGARKYIISIEWTNAEGGDSSLVFEVEEGKGKSFYKSIPESGENPL